MSKLRKIGEVAAELGREAGTSLLTALNAVSQATDFILDVAGYAIGKPLLMVGKVIHERAPKLEKFVRRFDYRIDNTSVVHAAVGVAALGVVVATVIISGGGLLFWAGMGVLYTMGSTGRARKVEARVAARHAAREARAAASLETPATTDEAPTTEPTEMGLVGRSVSTPGLGRMASPLSRIAGPRTRTATPSIVPQSTSRSGNERTLL